MEKVNIGIGAWQVRVVSHACMTCEVGTKSHGRVDVTGPVTASAATDWIVIRIRTHVRDDSELRPSEV
jgi:hypothetical protein